MESLSQLLDLHRRAPPGLLLLLLVVTVFFGAVLFYLALFIVAPIPRKSLSSEKTFRTILPDGRISDPSQLPCWQDKYNARQEEALRQGVNCDTASGLEEPEVFVSLVVPAYNEEERLDAMLAEAVDYLRSEFGHPIAKSSQANGKLEESMSRRKKVVNGGVSTSHTSANPAATGWEVLIVSDGSTDRTIETALKFARNLEGEAAAAIRVIALHENRGKGGAVTHGMRHVRGQYAIFADADGASKFGDLGKLLQACKRIQDKDGRAVAVGSRNHLVGSEAVVKRSFLRNLLMHSFHLFLRLLTPPATAAIRDTQCGFKLFSRPSLPYIIPYMHSEGWIFDVEMLMLAESAGIPVEEVPIGWKEVKGSKLNVLWDSLGMAWGLAVLRAAWGFGVYRRY
ncbi:MAG: dolichyl-phosphate beta-glucosyltransferase [Lasallia pustulata]|uniref:dolichyl-phosphate beta-glucosyltransferase n=1 Tax=Lasallia pustulata TaxID=136370 RepID=A0A5M8PQI9_9LECA|nr:MAG: dolichyl-phosphate beta-glucosyltransferase [Lasallia pustulata]